MSAFSQRGSGFWLPRVHTIFRNYMRTLYEVKVRPHPEFLELVSMATRRLLELAYAEGALDASLLLSRIDVLIQEIGGRLELWDERKQELHDTLVEFQAAWERELAALPSPGAPAAGADPAAPGPPGAATEQRGTAPANAAPGGVAPAHAAPGGAASAAAPGGPEASGDARYDGTFAYLLSPTHFDAELLLIFLSETAEQLPAVERALVAHEQRPQEIGLVNEMFRALHTLKGNAGFLGLQEFTGLTHAMEQYLDLVRSHRLALDSQGPDLLFQGLDVLSGMLANLRARFHQVTTGAEPPALSPVAWQGLADAFYRLAAG
ncbi:MAG: Hpt domain-containing protein [Candidatus Lambdaproteobacteria bacterium]|nr:Hpt domain-containing protein [Candidatus Lambdaproteobacteria bacterium]